MRTKLRDRTTGGFVDCDAEPIDDYWFFIRVPSSQLKPYYEGSDHITNVPQNWQFPGGPDGPKNVIGSSAQGTDLILYLESEAQTRARLKHL